jgi:hypothetical protein
MEIRLLTKIYISIIKFCTYLLFIYFIGVVGFYNLLIFSSTDGVLKQILPPDGPGLSMPVVGFRIVVLASFLILFFLQIVLIVIRKKSIDYFMSDTILESKNIRTKLIFIEFIKIIILLLFIYLFIRDGNPETALFYSIAKQLFLVFSIIYGIFDLFVIFYKKKNILEALLNIK